MIHANEKQPTLLEEYAIEGFDAYSKAANGLTYDGKPIPKWNDLGEKVKECWLAAAHAVGTKADPNFLTAQSPEPHWHNKFTERERQEIAFAQVYTDQFAHGTTGHNALIIIAKLARLLDER